MWEDAGLGAKGRRRDRGGTAGGRDGHWRTVPVQRRNSSRNGRRWMIRQWTALQ